MFLCFKKRLTFWDLYILTIEKLKKKLSEKPEKRPNVECPLAPPTSSVGLSFPPHGQKLSSASNTKVNQASTIHLLLKGCTTRPLEHISCKYGCVIFLLALVWDPVRARVHSNHFSGARRYTATPAATFAPALQSVATARLG